MKITRSKIGAARITVVVVLKILLSPKRRNTTYNMPRGNDTRR